MAYLDEEKPSIIKVDTCKITKLFYWNLTTIIR